MPIIQNERIPFYRPGADLTGVANAAVIGKRCVKISGNRNIDFLEKVSKLPGRRHT